jgi:hypothetical protein
VIDGALRRPCFGVFVIDRHVPVFERDGRNLVVYLPDSVHCSVCRHLNETSESRSLIWETWPRVVPGRLRRIPSAAPWRARCSNRSRKCLILSVLAADCGEQKGKIGRKSAGSSTHTINLNSQPLSKQ